MIKEPELKESYDVDYVIDVGCGYGTDWLYEKTPGANLILFDANEDYEEFLDNKYPEAMIYLCGLGSKREVRQIDIDEDNPLMSSFLKRTKLTETKSKKTARSVHIVTLDCLTKGLAGRIFLKIDTEGYEMEVLRGSVETLKKTDYVLCEVSINKRFKCSYEKQELMDFMAAHGFTSHEVLTEIPRKYQDILFSRS